VTFRNFVHHFFSNLEMLITKSNNASAEARSKTASN